MFDSLFIIYYKVSNQFFLVLTLGVDNGIFLLYSMISDVKFLNQ
jgi:hypothetical protein